LKPAPELVCLLDPPDFLAPRKLRFRRKLEDQPPQRFLHPLWQLLVIRSVRTRARLSRTAADAVILKPPQLIFVG